jgi:cellobiose-specific phosphotransferase system component IIA
LGHQQGIICPDVLFGRGCDYARIQSRSKAQLFEKKTCHLGIDDANRAIRQLHQTKEDLLSKNMVDSSCSFDFSLIHVKRGKCGTEALANVILDSKRIKVVKPSDMRQLYAALKTACS